jgi:hypothetical protein
MSIKKESEKVLVDSLLTNIFNKSTIKFVGSNIYQPYGGWDNLSDEDAAKLFSVLRDSKTSKRTEFIVEGDETIINELKQIPSNYAWGLSFDEAVKYLQEKGISWEIVHEDEAAEV